LKRKTLKQKLKSQLREVSQLRDAEHHQAGLTINYETQAMQSVAMAHGVMATLILCKNNMDVESTEFKAIEEQSQNRIAQCLVHLVGMGISAEEANARILRGH
jgi:hypothetical protein